MMKILVLLSALLLPQAALAQGNCVVPANAAATPVVSAVLEGSHVLKAGPGCLLAAYAVVDSTTAGYILVFNSTTVPANGAVTPVHCIPIAVSSYNFINFAPQPPEWYSAGITIVFSSTGCFTKTISAHAFFHALVQ